MTRSSAHARPDALVMHPGPMNRGVEIASEICRRPQSVIAEQVEMGVAVRMAVMETLLVPGGPAMSAPVVIEGVRIVDPSPQSHETGSRSNIDGRIARPEPAP